MLGKIMQVNGITNTITTIGQARPIHLVSNSKKIQVWQKIFEHASNARIICVLRLLTWMRNFNTNYNLAEIYNNFDVSELEDLTIDYADLSSE